VADHDVADHVIDACSLINLCATGELEAWLQVLGSRWHVPKAVQSESLYLRIKHADGTVAREAISLDSAIKSKSLDICEPIGEAETELYLELAVLLDDGEAMALAIAKARQWTLATDDRKAVALAQRLNVSVTTTPELVQKWSEKSGASRDAIREVLLRIQDRARFFPNDRSPLHGWWFEIADSG
jgi:predicted nucleic acid-binding protein